MLEVRNVRAAYGRRVALEDVSIDVTDGGFTALLGANGAGKTTLLRVISGLLRPKSGTVVFNGASIAGLSPPQILRRGIVHVPEGRQVFPDLTVLENLQMGAVLRSDRKAIAADIERMYEYFPRLRERSKQHAGTLSGGEQQMLAIARGLMAKPALLLLDEPSLGLAPIIIGEIFTMLATIARTERIAMLLVEQNVGIALDVVNDAYVVTNGRITLAGSAAMLRESEEIQASYLS